MSSSLTDDGAAWMREILEARARELARAPAPAAPADLLDVIVFSVGESVYALPCSEVAGLFRAEDVAWAPDARSWFAGLTLWRGELLTLVELAPMRGGARAEHSDAGCWVAVAALAGAPVGILCDSAPQLSTLRLAELTPPGLVPERGAALLRGVTPTAVLLIDPLSFSRALNQG